MAPHKLADLGDRLKWFANVAPRIASGENLTRVSGNHGPITTKTQLPVTGSRERRLHRVASLHDSRTASCRPPLTLDRLTTQASGQIVYELKHFSRTAPPTSSSSLWNFWLSWRLQEKRFLPLNHVKAVLELPDTQSLIASERMPGIEHFLPALLDSTWHKPSC